MSLRPDQLEAKAAIAAAYAQGAGAVLALCPTGWGKTHVAADLLAGATAKGRATAFFTDREEIALDTAARLRAGGLRTGVVMADEPTDEGAAVQVVSIPTAVARGYVPPGLAWGIWDECHHLGSPTWRGLFDETRRRGARALGITATAQRGDGRPLDMFDALVAGPSVRWCTERGLLVPADVVAPPDVEERGLVAEPVDAYERWAAGQRAAVFCAGVTHVHHTVATFRARGWAAEGVVADTDRATRRALRERLASGELRVLVGCGVFIEGFDAPALECVILARAFGVCGTFLQAIGRGLRLFPGKARCTVVDLRGSVHLHGLPDEDRVWSLDGAAVRRAETRAALRRCGECLAIFRPCAACPRCGAPARAAAKLPRVLNRAERLARLAGVPQHVRDAKYLARLEAVAIERMRKPEREARAWARAQFQRTRGRAPEVAA
jgi:DNA repair protein RadD